jgi:hypothetical protein
MEDKNTAFDLQKVLQCCFTIQSERIRRALLYEATSLKLLPDLHRELLALAKLAQLVAFNSQRESSEPGEARSPAGTTTQTEVRQEIRDLDPEDRHLLREVITILAEQEKNKENQNTLELKEQNNDQKKPGVEQITQ